MNVGSEWGQTIFSSVQTAPKSKECEKLLSEMMGRKILFTSELQTIGYTDDF